MQKERLVASGGLDGPGEALGVALLEGSLLPESGADVAGVRRGAVRPDLEAEEMTVKDAAADGEDRGREGPPEKSRDVLRDPRLVPGRVGGEVRVERDLGPEFLLWWRFEPGDRDRLAEQLVERLLPQLACRPVDGGRESRDGNEGVDDGNRFGEDGGDRLEGEKEVSLGKGRGSRRIVRAGEDAAAPETGEVDRDTGVGSPGLEKASRVGGFPAEEGDVGRLQRVGRRGGDEGGLALLLGEEPVGAAGVEEKGAGGRKAALLEDGQDVAPEERSSVRARRRRGRGGTTRGSSRGPLLQPDGGIGVFSPGPEAFRERNEGRRVRSLVTGAESE